MSLRRQPTPRRASQHSQGFESSSIPLRLDTVLHLGAARSVVMATKGNQVGVAPTFAVKGGRGVWTVTAKLLATNPKGGHAWLKIELGKPVVKSTFMYQLSKAQAAVVQIETPDFIEDPDAGDYVYFMNLPSAAGKENFDALVIDKVRKVADLMRTPYPKSGTLPEAIVDGWFVFTIEE